MKEFKPISGTEVVEVVNPNGNVDLKKVDDELEKIQKLNRKEKFFVKRLLKKFYKKLDRLKKKRFLVENKKTRVKLIDALTNLNDIFEMYDDDDKLITKEEFENMSTDELFDLLEKSLDEMEKVI